MIYRLETGIDNEIKEKVITAAVILATTVGAPAVAAVFNRISPYEGFSPRQAVLGINDQPEGSRNDETNDKNSDNQDTDKSTAQGALNSHSHQELSIAPSSSDKKNYTQPFTGSCDCLTETTDKAELPDLQIKPDELNEEHDTEFESTNNAGVELDVDVDGILGTGTRIEIEENSSSSL